jgi:predicted transcriptional regulator
MKRQNSQARDKVLNLLLWCPAEQFYEKEISEKAKVSKSSVNLIMKPLVEEGWLSLTEKGRLNLYQVNLNSAKVRSYKKSLTVNKLDNLINHLKGKVEKLILFGSAAKGEDVMTSDLDLMIVSDRGVEIKRVRQLLPSDRHGQIIIKTSDEFRELKFKNKVFYQAVNQGERLI